MMGAIVFIFFSCTKMVHVQPQEAARDWRLVIYGCTERKFQKYKLIIVEG